MYMFLVLIVAAVLAVLVPFGPILLIGIAVALVAENYRQTMKMREDILAIKNHLGLMNKQEAEQYEMERKNKDVSQLSPDEMKSLNQEIEAELARDSKKNT
ncbi:hypothetical protein [Paenibacillus sp. MER 99-2]|uniref:hypothetical protein n=1 Tax=Paenibacillus sp. MER 99-2 TaxID=2939572 RepID=UPI00203A51E2|nr:hypothetical protein [Paenibacillus sp. MER 99-2]MCM3171624.1 hypothetical protein [Paenibacillus sp. MER 99-2]